MAQRSAQVGVTQLVNMTPSTQLTGHSSHISSTSSTGAGVSVAPSEKHEPPVKTSTETVANQDISPSNVMLHCVTSSTPPLTKARPVIGGKVTAKLPKHLQKQLKQEEISGNEWQHMREVSSFSSGSDGEKIYGVSSGKSKRAHFSDEAEELSSPYPFPTEEELKASKPRKSNLKSTPQPATDPHQSSDNDQNISLSASGFSSAEENIADKSPRNSTEPDERKSFSMPKLEAGLQKMNVMQKNDDALVLTDMPLNPISRFNVLADMVTETLTKNDINVVWDIQARIWPYIRRMSDIVAIAPKKSGKTVGYIAQVLTNLTNDVMYERLKPGYGPKVLILSSSWKTAQSIYDVCREIISHDQPRRDSKGKPVKKLETIVIYGGGSETHQAIPLLNGCDILIATPHSLLRVLEKKYTNFDRVCHLILDDGDILTGQMTEQIKLIMRKYMMLMKERCKQSLPQQTIVMSSKWTTGIQSFVRAYTPEAPVLITCKFEAAIFGGVKQIVTVCYEANHLNKVLELLDHGFTKKRKTVIFTSDPDDAQKIYEMLKSQCYNVITAHEMMVQQAILTTEEMWHATYKSGDHPILVLTDECQQQLKIRDAQCVIHYDMVSKQKFGTRLWALKNNLNNPLINPDVNITDEQQCMSYIMLTEKAEKKALHVHNLMGRLKEPIHSTLEKLVSNYLQSEDVDLSKDLCHYLKSFGECREGTSCLSRHSISPILDLPGKYTSSLNLPSNGEVKLKITHVKDTMLYYARVLEHRPYNSETKTINLGATYGVLVLDMIQYYSSPANREPFGRPKKDAVCAVQGKGNVFYRVKVLDTPMQDLKGHILPFNGQYLDEGRTEVVNQSQLYKLPDNLLEIPPQAVQVYLCRIKPYDMDIAWPLKSVVYVDKKICGCEMDGRIVLSLNNTLWLDPLVHREYLPTLKMTTNAYELRREILQNNLAIENPDHINLLYKQCEGRIELPDTTPPKKEDRAKIPETEVLPEGEQDHIVQISYVASPGCFFVHKRENIQSLNDLTDDINTRIEEARNLNIPISTGMLCIAKFDEDEENDAVEADQAQCEWYRGVTLACRNSIEFEVFFLDYGERSWVKKNDILPILDAHRELPFQAIECCIADVQPRDSSWSEESGDYLHSLGRRVNTDDEEEAINLVARLTQTSTPEFAGCLGHSQKNHIELIDTTSTSDIYLGQQLVIAGHAIGSKPEAIQALFPGATELTVYDDYRKIPSLCKAICEAEDDNICLEFARELFELVRSSHVDEVCDSGGLKSLCSLAGVPKSVETLCCVVLSLTFLAMNSQRNCDQIRSDGGLKTLCNLLCKCEDPRLQSDVAITLEKLALHSEQNRKEIKEFQGVKTLCRIIGESTDTKVRKTCSTTLAQLCKGSPGNCKLVKSLGGLKTLSSLVGCTADHDALVAITTVLGVLAASSSNKETIRREGGLKSMCDNLENTPSIKVQAATLKTLKHVVTKNKWNRDLAIQLGVSKVINRIIESQDNEKLVTLCADLQKKMAPAVSPTKGHSKHSEHNIRSSSQVITAKPLEKSDLMCHIDFTKVDVGAAVTPSVHWSQNRGKVVLNIQLKGVVHKHIEFKEDRFIFRAYVNNNLYQLNLELYGGLKPAECKVSVRAMEILVAIYKSTLGRWPRLLKTSERQPWLSVDFSRFVDSSSEDEEDWNSSEDELSTYLVCKRRYTPSPFGLTKEPSKYPTGQPAGLDDTSESESEEDRFDDHDDYDRFNIFDVRS
ncbi:unnamed protein product [Owenia fusiformis]|uniref:RNA helicase n=1 Tax=Owenia fusiformis TaxID=6347 RepID=A0A8S4NEW3_OWEFU|nr:unnamed protein product [Owenia fusiformis]